MVKPAAFLAAIVFLFALMSASPTVASADVRIQNNTGRDIRIEAHYKGGNMGATVSTSTPPGRIATYPIKRQQTIHDVLNLLEIRAEEIVKPRSPFIPFTCSMRVTTDGTWRVVLRNQGADCAFER